MSSLELPSALFDRCPDWCYPLDSEMTNGGDHAGDPHRGRAGEVEISDYPSLTVVLHAPNVHGQEREKVEMPRPRGFVAVHASGDIEDALILRPSEARSLAALLIHAADRLEVGMRKGKGW